MSIERRFLGWHRPALHIAAEFLHDEFRAGTRWDMSSVAVALPGARAGRRLRELLAIRAASLAESGERVILTPPRIITVGELPELFYTPQKRVATEMEAIVAWAGALRRIPAQALRHIFPGARDTDPVNLFALAAEAVAIDKELAAECISYSDLEAYCAGRAHTAGAARWKAFAQALRLFHAALAEDGHISRDQARTDALHGEIRSERTVVVVACADLPAITRKMLNSAQSRIVVLVHATEDETEGFDETGALHTQFWATTIPIALSDDGLKIVDFPRDQARAVAQMVQSMPGLDAGMISVGVCEESMGASIERAVELCGKRARRAVGMRLSSSPPAQLLSLLATYLRDRQAEHFAALIRHPDLNDWLVKTLAWPEPAGPWLDLCDRYIADHLPVTIDLETKSMPSELARATHAIWELVGKDRGTQPLSACIERITQILTRIYATDDERKIDPDPSHVLLASALRDLSLPTHRDHDLKLTFSEAMGFLLAASGDQSVPAESRAPQIDLIGWLEAHLDDAPVLILAGFNEGIVPQSVLGDAFLPDSLRRDLGLPDNARRYARDAYLLSAILTSRPRVRIIYGRYGAQNEPLAPSRLLLACPPEEMIRRILDFYGRAAWEDSVAEPITPNETYALAAIPRPKRKAKPLSKLRVTAFREYLTCPYRFYLKYVLGLSHVDDSYVEMRPDAFGDLLHKIMQDFGKWVLRERSGIPADPKTISQFLRDSLERRARTRFGEPMHPAVAIQVELLGRRLEAFARFQAAEADAGWMILAIERTLKAELDIDDAPFIVEGRIDRIDFHPGRGLYRILDYKSRDGGCDPETSHRDSQGWIDLQLPLYKRLAALIDIDREIDPKLVEVGYIALPKDLQKIGYAPAPWTEDEFHEAYLKADDVIKAIRNQVFWPPNLTPPLHDDGYGAICLDDALDRQAIIELDMGDEAVWPEQVSGEVIHGD